MHRRELAQRSADGLEVSLLWDPIDDYLSVRVVDTRADETFEVPVGNAKPLDVFEHPFGYLARYEAALLAAA
ncbi:MAG TPA: hypothetical protein VE693_06085 [Gaiellaceae bacterium]|jgi:hypothetical protein|nr:hypothetical protein [Gaiellaceae bacterium]